MSTIPKITGQFGKGNPGKPKGAVQKSTKQLKEMILGALEQAGGVDYLLACANNEKTQGAFLALIGKVLPMTIAGDANAPVRFSIDLPWLQQSIQKRNSE